MKNTLKTIVYMSTLCAFSFNTVPLHAAGVPASAPAAAPEGYLQQAKRTVWNAVVSPEALIAASLAGAGYTRSVEGLWLGSVGTLLGSGRMAHVRSDWRKTAGIIGTALSGAGVGGPLVFYALLIYTAKKRGIGPIVRPPLIGPITPP